MVSHVEAFLEVKAMSSMERISAVEQDCLAHLIPCVLIDPVNKAPSVTPPFCEDKCAEFGDIGRLSAPERVEYPRSIVSGRSSRWTGKQAVNSSFVLASRMSPLYILHTPVKFKCRKTSLFVTRPI
jgi:hypothetical protein